VLDGPWKIERRVPLFALSRETTRFENLKRSLALYRLTFRRRPALKQALAEGVPPSEVMLSTVLLYP
jgi:hypothetical protein